MAGVKMIAIESLIPDPANCRVHSEKNIDAIARSILRFGAGRSIVIDGDGVVRAGNGTLEAAKEAGIEKVMVIDADGKTLVAVRRADWSPVEGAVYGYADNKLTDQSKFDKERVEDLFRGVLDCKDAEGLVQACGISEAELSKMLEAANPEPVDVSFQANPAADDEEITCPKCGFQWTE